MCSEVLKNGKPPGGPAVAPPQCRECEAPGTKFGTRGCTTEGLCTTGDGKDLARLGKLILLNGGTETAGVSEDEAKKRAGEMMPRVRGLLDPYTNINRILNDILAAHESKTAEPYIECDIIRNVYAIYSYINGRSMDDIEKGVERINAAYVYAKQKFSEAAAADPDKLYRKDGRTPLFAHSTRQAMMAAYIGARSDTIAGLLCHDLVEDCRTTSERIRKEIGTGGKSEGYRMKAFIALLTKPVLTEIETIDSQTQRKQTTQMWVLYIEDPMLWSTCTQLPCRERYTERMNLHYDSILNADPAHAPADIRLQAFLGKMLDALDNLVTDRYLDSVNAGLRAAVLVLQTRHLEVLAPGLRDIIVKLLKERGYGVPEKMKRWEPEEGAIVLQPPVDKIDVSVLDRMPAPNGYITIYADDSEIQKLMDEGIYNAPLRVELPHTARPDSCEIIAEFFNTMHPNARFVFERGKSLLPSGSEAAGTVIMVSGVDNTQKFEILKTGLEAFYRMRKDVMEREGHAEMLPAEKRDGPKADSGESNS